MSTTNDTDEVGNTDSGMTADELKAQLRERYGEYAPPASDADVDADSNTDSDNNSDSDSDTPTSGRRSNIYASEKRHIIWVPQKTNVILLQNPENGGSGGIDTEGGREGESDDNDEEGSEKQGESEDDESSLYVSLLGFTDSEGWKMGKGYYRDIDPDNSEMSADTGEIGEREQSTLESESESEFEAEDEPADTGKPAGVSFTDKQWDHFYGVTHGDTTHVVKSEIVDSIAEILDVSPPSLLDTARIRPDQEIYPIMFDEKVPGGKLIVLPIEDSETGGSPLCDLSF